MADYLNIAGRVRTTASDGVAMEAQEVKDLNLNKSQQEVNADVQTELGDRYTKEETYSKEQLDELITTPDVNYVSVVATNLTTAVTDVLPATGEADTIYRVGNWNGTQYDPTMYALYAWNGSAYVCLAVRSFVGEVYDISVNHPDGQGNPTPYADLAAALGTGGANIPADIRRGGMSIKFIQGTVQSSDNKYVQYRLMKDEWSIDAKDWAACTNSVISENPEFVYVELDSANNILWGVQKDNNFFFGGGCPIQVKNFVLIHKNEILSLLSTKVDKIIGKSLIDENYANSISVINNPEYAKVVIDEEGNVVEGLWRNGVKAFPYGIETPIINDILYIDKLLPKVQGDFLSSMSRTEIITLYNNKLNDFAKLCKCNKSSFCDLSVDDSDSLLYWKINHNFRKDVVYTGISKDMFCAQLNKYFTIPIFRFCDAKINNTDNPDCSLRVLFDKDSVSRVNVEGYTTNSFRCIKSGTQNTPITITGNSVVINNGWMAIDYNSSYPLYQAGENYLSGYTLLFEPSTLISDDEQKIELFGQIGYTESEDGVNWSEIIPFNLPSGHRNCSHGSVNKVDGIYMMVGCTSNGAGTTENPVYMDLWTSTDRINWQWRGHLVSTTDDIGNGESLIILGNSYLFKDNGGTYYLYYEGARTSPNWETCLMTCTDLFYDRGNGFIGNWQQYENNPIFPYKYNPFTGESAFCNPEFVKGKDNQPIKYNGKYYMYYLSGYTIDGVIQDTINRMYSYDLTHWTDEGVIFDNRDIADGGERRGDNGDQSMCEFKGKTFLFYTHNMNNYGYSDANIRYTIDDRPQVELLKIKP